MKSTRANRILSIILSLSIVIGITTISKETVLADTDDSTGLEYMTTEVEAIISGFTAPPGFDGALAIPDTLGGKSVTTIGWTAFQFCTSLTSVTMPSSVTSIEHGAFRNCSNLTSITEMSSVTNIGYGAFSDCSSLTSITISSCGTNIDDGTFEGCSSLTSITIPSSVTRIGPSAFRDCTSLTSVTIPSGVTSIEPSAFNECTGIRVVTFQGKVTSINSYSFGSYSEGTITFFVPNGLKTYYEDILTKDVLLNTTAIILEVPPSAPTNLKAVSAGYNSDTLTWSAVPGATGYEIYRSTSDSSGFVTIATTSSTSYTDIGLTTGTTYYYQIKAYTTVDTTNIYSEATTAVSAKPIPATPTGLKAVSAGYNSNKITWTAVTGASGYSIYRSTSPTSSFAYIKAVTTASYTNTGLTTGTTYYYQIKAYTLVDSTKNYSAATAAVSATPLPATPTGLKAISAGYNSNKITWTAVTGATGYSIYRSTSPTSGFAYIKAVTSASYTNTGLTTGTTYYYQIKAYTLVGSTKIYSAFSSVVSAKPVPAAPTGLTAARASATSIKISWNTVTGATGYAMYRSTSPTSGFTYVKSVTSASYTNTGLTTGTKYYYQVKAYRTVGTTKIYSVITTAVNATP